MARQFPRLTPELSHFVGQQPIFFTASATADSRVNISPRSTDALRVLSPDCVIYLDRTGSGNETAAHLRADGRLTIMLCAFSGAPRILRLYGRGTILHRDSTEFAEVLDLYFDGLAPLGTRQMVRLQIDLVQTSCGYGVPLFEYVQERDGLDRWSENKGEAGIQAYWERENRLSIDGLETGIND